MAVKSWSPSGAVGTQLTEANRPTELANIVNNAGNQLTYDAAAAMARGTVGIRATATVAAENASMRMDNTQLAWGSARCYMRARAWPSVNTDIFGLRSSAGNAVRFFLGTTGVLTLQNNAGAVIPGFSYQASLLTPLRLSIQGAPGTTTTSGTAAAQVYDDEGVLLSQFPETGGLNLGTTANILSARMGKNGTAGTFDVDFTQLAFDTSSSALGPLGGVAKTTAPPTGSNTSPAAALQNDVVALSGTSSSGTTVAWSVPVYPATMGGPPPITNSTSLTTASFTAIAPGNYTTRLTLTTSGGTATYDKALVVSTLTRVSRGVWNGTSYR